MIGCYATSIALNPKYTALSHVENINVCHISITLIYSRGANTAFCKMQNIDKHLSSMISLQAGLVILFRCFRKQNAPCLLRITVFRIQLQNSNATKLPF